MHHANPTDRLRRRLFALALGGTSLLAATIGVTALTEGEAAAQPTRRDTPLKTPVKRRLPALRPAQRPAPNAAGDKDDKGADKVEAKQGNTGATGAEAAAGNNPGKTGIGVQPDIAFKGPPPGGRVNFNLRDADLPDLVEAITAITGRRFIFGGKLRSIKATIVSPKDVTGAEAYQAFLSVLETNGMTVVPHGRYLKIVETKGAQSQTTPILGTVEPVPYTDRYVTRLYRLKHVDAGEVSNILGKFKSADADITVYSPSNLLIITDTGANIRRQLRIVEELDAGQAGSQIYMQPVHNSAAGDVAATLNEMLEGSQAKILPEERSNSLVIVANENDYGRILDLLKAVDTPLDGGDDQIHVLPLQHARCDELQTTLSSILGGGGGGARRPTGAAGRAAGRTASPAAAGGTASAEGGEIFEGDVRVNCDEATNALVSVSSLRDYAQLRNVIDKLDKPRRQVFIEAVIMDVNVDHTNDTGVAFHGGATADLGGGGDTIFYGGSNPQQSLTGLPANLEALAFGVRGPDLDGTEEGVIVACGGMTGGYSMYLRDGALHYDYNFLDGVHYHLTSGPLPKGETVLTFDFERTGPFAGTGRILVNGEEADRTEMPKMHLATYSLAETFDVGLDTGTQVDPGYGGTPFPFTGDLDRVVITLRD